ncbi:hypothetical protein NECAME_16882 [Necator americanus]|uniref:Uncharacterized protein n=1 Tax=Necator americanus TaxID=51031 RepID=W2TTR9_NECAM|nr:hypothetical protein NECAME_16882 [Necator americanus]ETN85183.1 hypothetical protein NECAME_16882 [Necator americanus]
MEPNATERTRNIKRNFGIRQRIDLTLFSKIEECQAFNQAIRIILMNIVLVAVYPNQGYYCIF